MPLAIRTAFRKTIFPSSSRALYLPSRFRGGLYDGATCFTPRSAQWPFLQCQTRSISYVLQSVRNNKTRTPGSSRYNDSTYWRNTAPRQPTSGGPSPSNRQSFFDRVRHWLNGVPRSFILWGTLIANGLVYLSWQYAADTYRNHGDPARVRWLQENFTVSLDNFASGRFWTLLTACFSHEGAAHILLNGLTFYWMAPGVMSMIGNARFLSLYLGGGIVASAVSLFWHNQVKRHNISSHGASGAINAVLAFFACALPRSTLLIFGIIPCPAWVAVGGFFAWDLYSALADKRTRTDTAGHVGGMLAGAAYFMRFRGGLPRF